MELKYEKNLCTRNRRWLKGHKKAQFLPTNHAHTNYYIDLTTIKEPRQ